MSIRTTLKKLTTVRRKLKQAHAAIADELQEVLRELAGQSFPTHDEAAETTAVIQEVMQQLGLRARCPKTGEACNLRCTQVRSRTTTFQLERNLKGKRKVTAAFTTFPDVELVDAPPDLRRKKRD